MNNPMDDPDYLKISQLVNKLGICRSTLLNLIREGRFPKPYRFGDRLLRWKVTEVNQWLAHQKK